MNPRTLTPNEIQNLPHCRWSWDTKAKCFEEKQPQETKDCLRCCLEGMLIALCHADEGGIVTATHTLDAMCAMLQELKVLNF